MSIRKQRSLPQPVSAILWHGFPITSALSLIVGFCAILAPARDAKKGAKDVAPTRQAKLSGEEYTGSAACAQCHREIYEQFSRTGMGRSLSTVTPTFLKTLRASASVEDQDPNVHLEVNVRDGKLYQTQFETGADGQEIYRDTREVEWIVGSGANGLSGLVRRDDSLVQAPLSFYIRPQRWGLSPGYELGNYGFSRPILPACIFCHSGRPNPVPDGNGRFENPPFSELPIGCENCHGPGLSHVLAMQMGFQDYKGGHDPSIVNPAYLAPALADNICTSCHQTGDVRVLQPGKDYKDFRPGTPLDNTLSILMVPPKRESPPQSDLLEHYYSMTLSKCYRASGKKLSCISCHDPHVEPSREEAPEYFAKKCLTCHSDKSCTLPLEVRQRQQPADDCAGCHMPKRDVIEISHSSITNHRILVRPDEPFPEFAFQQNTPAPPDLIHLDPVPGQKETPPSALILLQAYGELSEKHPEYLKRYIEVLDQLENTDSGNPLVQAALGNQDLQAGRYSQAITHLQRALDAGPPKTVLYTDLADALVKMGRTREAVAVLRKATDLDPFNSVVQRTLIVHLIELKEYVDAQTALENYVARFPEDSFMRQMLARARAAGLPK
jgi:Tetratricopeptide repeat